MIPTTMIGFVYLAAAALVAGFFWTLGCHLCAKMVAK